MKKVGIIMGSDSDLPVVEKAVQTLRAYGLPVIGIPIKSSNLDGIDALLSTVQMPSGIPVATVAIDGAVNAALLSVQILAVEDAALADRLEQARAEAAAKVLEKNAAIEQQFRAE